MTNLLILVGYLSAYAQLPTEATIAARQKYGHIPPSLSAYDGVMAVEDCSLVGKEGWLIAGNEILKVMIFDCAANDGTPEWMATNRILGEVGWGLWQQYPHLVGEAGTLIVGEIPCMERVES